MNKIETSIAPQALSITDAARALGVGRSTVYNLLAAGELKAIKIGRRRLVRVRDIEAFLSRAGGAA